METQNQIIVKVLFKLQTTKWELSKIKDQAMDADFDELASEINAVQNHLELNERAMKNLLIKLNLKP